MLLAKMFYIPLQAVSILSEFEMKIRTYNWMGSSFIFAQLECHVISSVFYIPRTYHPAIPYISSRWRSSVSSGETSTGNVKKYHWEDKGALGLWPVMN